MVDSFRTEHPVTFSEVDVNLILNNEKTQFRIEMDLQPEDNIKHITVLNDGTQYHDTPAERIHILSPKSPYIPGDLLWVRETWATARKDDDKEPSEFIDIGEQLLWYKATQPNADKGLQILPEPLRCGKWRSPEQMPKGFSRLRLEVTNVYAHKIEDILIDEIEKEGIQPQPVFNKDGEPEPDEGETFAEFVNNFYGIPLTELKENPWLWVFSFRVVFV